MVLEMDRISDYQVNESGFGIMVEESIKLLTRELKFFFVFDPSLNRFNNFVSLLDLASRISLKNANIVTKNKAMAYEDLYFRLNGVDVEEGLAINQTELLVVIHHRNFPVSSELISTIRQLDHLPTNAELKLAVLLDYGLSVTEALDKLMKNLSLVKVKALRLYPSLREEDLTSQDWHEYDPFYQPVGFEDGYYLEALHSLVGQGMTPSEAVKELPALTLQQLEYVIDGLTLTQVNSLTSSQCDRFLQLSKYRRDGALTVEAAQCMMSSALILENRCTYSHVDVFVKMLQSSMDFKVALQSVSSLNDHQARYVSQGLDYEWAVHFSHSGPLQALSCLSTKGLRPEHMLSRPWFTEWGHSAALEHLIHRGYLLNEALQVIDHYSDIPGSFLSPEVFLQCIEVHSDSSISESQRVTASELSGLNPVQQLVLAYGKRYGISTDLVLKANFPPVFNQGDIVATVRAYGKLIHDGCQPSDELLNILLNMSWSQRQEVTNGCSIREVQRINENVLALFRKLAHTLKSSAEYKE